MDKEKIEELINKHSSFAFEKRVKSKLRSAGFTCEHGGTYYDYYQEKDREFDIRATKIFDGFAPYPKMLAIAVECKKISEEAPLIIYSEKLNDNSPIYSVLLCEEGNCVKNKIQQEDLDDIDPSIIKRNPILNYVQKKEKSKLGDSYNYVGKKMDQVKPPKGQSKEYQLTDKNIYEKFSQCQNSLVDLIRSSHKLVHSSYKKISRDPIYMLQVNCCSILVVPDGTLY